MMEKLYSIDGEMFGLHGVDEVLDALDDEGRLSDGEIYYSCDFEDIDLTTFLDAARILERAEDELYGEIGEAAEDAFAVTDEAVEEFDAFVAAWVKKHMSDRRYWGAVGRSEEHAVTEEDIASYVS